MMDQATHQQKRIYASFLSQIDWTKRILVHKSHEKNWINFQNWIWRRNGSASFNLVFWILVVEILMLMVNNNSTVATTWLDLLEFSNPSRSGIPARESQTGVWDPRRESGIPGNQSQTRFLGSLGFGVWDLMVPQSSIPGTDLGDDSRIPAVILCGTRVSLRGWSTPHRDDDEMITRALESCRVPYRNNSYPLVMTDNAKYISVAPSRWNQGIFLPNWRNTRNVLYATTTCRRRNDI